MTQNWESPPPPSNPMGPFLLYICPKSLSVTVYVVGDNKGLNSRSITAMRIYLASCVQQMKYDLDMLDMLDMLGDMEQIRVTGR